MSRSCETVCKGLTDIRMVEKAFERLGWRIVHNSTIRLFPGDPRQDQVFDAVAVNPKANGYDVGIVVPQNKGEAVELVTDLHYGGVADQLGRDFQYLYQPYNEAAIEQLASDNCGSLEYQGQTAEGHLHLKLTI